MRPRLLDLFCGAGGAGMGYHRAGFEVTGVDIAPQPRYPFAFIQADALDYLAVHGHEFEAVHASPPCQRYIRQSMVARDGRHPDLLGPTRGALQRLGRPWVIENVPGAPMVAHLILCGSMFGLAVRRHRWFEGHPPLLPFAFACNHAAEVAGVYGNRHGRRGAFVSAKKRMLPSTLTTWRRAMGIEWADKHRELTEAVPPAYTEFIGRQVFAMIRGGLEPGAIGVWL